MSHGVLGSCGSVSLVFEMEVDGIRLGVDDACRDRQVYEQAAVGYAADAVSDLLGGLVQQQPVPLMARDACLAYVQRQAGTKAAADLHQQLQPFLGVHMSPLSLVRCADTKAADLAAEFFPELGVKWPAHPWLATILAKRWLLKERYGAAADAWRLMGDEDVQRQQAARLEAQTTDAVWAAAWRHVHASLLAHKLKTEDRKRLSNKMPGGWEGGWVGRGVGSGRGRGGGRVSERWRARCSRIGPCRRLSHSERAASSHLPTPHRPPAQRPGRRHAAAVAGGCDAWRACAPRLVSLPPPAAQAGGGKGMGWRFPFAPARGGRHQAAGGQ